MRINNKKNYDSTRKTSQNHYNVFRTNSVRFTKTNSDTLKPLIGVIFASKLTNETCH